MAPKAPQSNSASCFSQALMTSPPDMTRWPGPPLPLWFGGPYPTPFHINYCFLAVQVVGSSQDQPLPLPFRVWAHPLPAGHRCLPLPKGESEGRASALAPALGPGMGPAEIFRWTPSVYTNARDFVPLPALPAFEKESGVGRCQNHNLTQRRKKK
jgi:hypothetical protein